MLIDQTLVVLLENESTDQSVNVVDCVPLTPGIPSGVSGGGGGGGGGCCEDQS